MIMYIMAYIYERESCGIGSWPINLKTVLWSNFAEAF